MYAKCDQRDLVSKQEEYIVCVRNDVGDGADTVRYSGGCLCSPKIIKTVINTPHDHVICLVRNKTTFVDAGENVIW